MYSSKIASGYALQQYLALFPNATLAFYGAASAPGIPASPETAPGNTVAATFTFSSTPFSVVAEGSPYCTAAANFVTANVTPVTSNAVGFARASWVASTWATAHPYTAGYLATVNSNLYVCAGTGTSAGSGSGPSATTQAIADGTCTWNYIGPSSNTAIADFTVGTSGSDIIVGNTAFQTGVAVDLSSFLIELPAV